MEIEYLMCETLTDFYFENQILNTNYILRLAFNFTK